MFKTGKFYNQIVCNIKPGEKFTSLVVNTEGLHLAGISGGKELIYVSEQSPAGRQRPRRPRFQKSLWNPGFESKLD